MKQEAPHFYYNFNHGFQYENMRVLFHFTLKKRLKKYTHVH